MEQRPGTVVQAFFTAFVPIFVLAIAQTALPVLAPSLMSAAGMPAEAFGWVSGAMGLGAVWLYMANAAFTTALGPVRACQVSGIVTGFGLLLMLSGRYAAMVLGAILVGFGYATTTPAGSQILADHTPREMRSTLFSLRQAGVPLGGAIAGIGGSWIATHIDWTAAIALVSALSLLVAPALIPAPRRFNESRPRTRFRFAALFALSNVLQPIRVVRRDRALLQISIASIGFATVQGTVSTYFVIYATSQLGFSLTYAGSLFATMQAMSVLGRIVLGFLADRIGSPRPVLRTLSILSSCAAIALATLDASWPAAAHYAVLVFMGLTVATWNGLWLAEIAAMAPDNVSEATASATFFVFGTYMVTPPLMGLVIKTWGYRPAFLLAAAFVAAALAILSLAPRRAP